MTTDQHRRTLRGPAKRRWEQHYKMTPRYLPLTVKERKFARNLGWHLGTVHPSFRAAYEWTMIRPDRTHCGFLCGIKEIRRARTLTFLSSHVT